MKRHKLMRILLSWIGQVVFTIVYGTSRWQVDGREHLDRAISSGKPIMVCVWHGRFSVPAYWMYKNKIHAWAIASRHGDADIIARIFQRWGFGLIRGSSSNDGRDKGGKDVIRRMATVFKASSENIIAVTNDGPKGPPRIAKPGSLSMARKYNVEIITITGTASKYWEAKSWDKFLLPKPFSKIRLVIAPPLKITEDIPIVNGSETLSDYMNKWQDYADERGVG
jgi:hypothetical protein